MKVAVIVLMIITSLTKSYGQVTLGAGIVKIEFTSKTVIDFYKRPDGKAYYKRIEFFDDKEINNWNIKNLETERTWLKPELLWLDYSQFNFRCKSITADWFELIVNNENGMTLWVRRAKETKYVTWEEYLKNMFGVNRLESSKQKIRNLPSDSAKEIEHQGRDCFEVKSLKGDWIEIKSTDHCDEGSSKTEIESGWIKWRDGEKLLIVYYTTS